MSEISSGLVAVRIDTDGYPLVRLSDAEAIIAQKDAEILDQCRLNGMGAEREAVLLGKVAQQAAALKLARLALSEGVEYVEEPPEKNCTCYLAPPCNDCVDHSAVREFFIDARKALAAIDNAAAKAAGMPEAEWSRQSATSTICGFTWRP